MRTVVIGSLCLGLKNEEIKQLKNEGGGGNLRWDD